MNSRIIGIFILEIDLKVFPLSCVSVHVQTFPDGAGLRYSQGGVSIQSASMYMSRPFKLVQACDTLKGAFLFRVLINCGSCSEQIVDQRFEDGEAKQCGNRSHVAPCGTSGLQFL